MDPIFVTRHPIKHSIHLDKNNSVVTDKTNVTETNNDLVTIWSAQDTIWKKNNKTRNKSKNVNWYINNYFNCHRLYILFRKYIQQRSIINLNCTSYIMYILYFFKNLNKNNIERLNRNKNFIISKDVIDLTNILNYYSKLLNSIVNNDHKRYILMKQDKSIVCGDINEFNHYQAMSDKCEMGYICRHNFKHNPDVILHAMKMILQQKNLSFITRVKDYCNSCGHNDILSIRWLYYNTFRIMYLLNCNNGDKYQQEESFAKAFNQFLMNRKVIDNMFELEWFDKVNSFVC